MRFLLILLLPFLTSCVTVMKKSDLSKERTESKFKYEKLQLEHQMLRQRHLKSLEEIIKMRDVIAKLRFNRMAYTHPATKETSQL